MATPGSQNRDEVMSPRSSLIASVAVFGLSLASLLLLARYLHVAPGSPFALEIDVLFSVDGADRWKELTAASPPRFSVSHFLLQHLWGRIGAVPARLLEFALPADEARFLAATGMVCVVAAMGFGSLAFCALRLNHRRWNLLLLFPVCLLFTSNTILVQPDHFGLSFGLLAIASLALLPGLRDRTRVGLIGVTGFLNAATTLTNGLFPALAAAVVFRKRLNPAHVWRYRYGILAAAALGGAIAATAIVPRLRDLNDTIIVQILNLRLLKDPPAAAGFAASGLVYPAVGPVPSIWRSADPNNPYSHQSYNPSGFDDYAPLSGVAACAWVALLAASSLALIRSPDLRDYRLALFGWIVFNLIFHNLWGDEFFLYSAHWSWTLMLIALLGSRALPTWAVALAVALIVPGQLATLSTIRDLIFA